MILTEMESVSVNSSLLTSVAFNVGESILELEFHDGACYRYFAVPAAIYEGLLAADSKGTYFNRRIRTCFRYTLIRRPG
jgi:hypothetical protein